MAKAIDEGLLKTFVSLTERRRKQQAALSALDKEYASMREKIMEYMTKRGVRSTKRGEYHITITDGPKYPKWKDAFIEQLGEDAANKLQDATPCSEKVLVTPVAIKKK